MEFGLDERECYGHLSCTLSTSDYISSDIIDKKKGSVVAIQKQPGADVFDRPDSADGITTGRCFEKGPFLTPFKCKSSCNNLVNFVKRCQRSIGQC